MTIFSRPTLHLSNNSTTVNPVDVIFYDNHDFWVDPNGYPRAENGSMLNIGTHPKPFQITDCNSYMVFFRKAKLKIDPADQATINDWHSTFDGRIAIILPVQTSNGIGRELAFDMFCDQHSMATRSKKRVREAIAFAASTFVHIVIALVTFKAFRGSRLEEGERNAAHSAGH